MEAFFKSLSKRLTRRKAPAAAVAKPSKTLRFRNNANARGFKLQGEVPENLTQENIEYIHNMIGSRNAPKYAHPGNIRGRYTFTAERPTNAPGHYKLSTLEAAIFAEAHEHARDRKEFKEKLKLYKFKGELNDTSYKKLLKRYNATYPVSATPVRTFGGKTVEEIERMSLADFDAFTARLNEKDSIALYRAMGV